MRDSNDRNKAKVNRINCSSTHLLPTFLFILLLNGIPCFVEAIPIQKVVRIMNNGTSISSVRCFSFFDDIPTQHLRSKASFSFSVRFTSFFSYSTMYNCSTNLGTFVVYRADHECARTDKDCSWMFDDHRAYMYSPKDNTWNMIYYNPNYESVERGGVMKGDNKN
ncbi:hypothetical protein Leryth_025427 [Lithospermum erythrorhizon]|nr:hypothetical protein Leryth_025427 [Lithospermum erythrorhizon]